jgi:hypothetical protein
MKKPLATWLKVTASGSAHKASDLPKETCVSVVVSCDKRVFSKISGFLRFLKRRLSKPRRE